jgi:precorrin-3B synthase
MTSLLAQVLSTPSPREGGEGVARRGACPGLSAPMQTGDGLLVRLMPIGTIAAAAFAELCAAARQHGNGIIEVTTRGNIQVRGLDTVSAPLFAAAVVSLGIAADDGVAVLTNALAGLDAEEILDAAALAATLRHALARGAMAARLAPKISVAIDGGGALNLDAVAADVRLCADSDGGAVSLRVGVGGNGATAIPLGVVAPADGVEAATRLLKVLAHRGRDTRARDILAAEGAAPFSSALVGLLLSPVRAGERRLSRSDEVIGPHPLRDGSFARGIALAFGHADATALESLAQAAKAGGGGGLRVAPGRALIAVGLTKKAALAFAADAERLGFIVHGGDPRRRVIACAGAPICASGHIAARTLGPLVANIAGSYLDGSRTIHVSGCAKGCAHPSPAALTVVGTLDGCALIPSGSTRDVPRLVVAADELAAAISRFVHERRREDNHV